MAKDANISQEFFPFRGVGRTLGVASEDVKMTVTKRNTEKGQ